MMNAIENQVNMYIENALKQQSANIHAKFDEEEMFDMDRMYKKITNKFRFQHVCFCGEDEDECNCTNKVIPSNIFRNISALKYCKEICDKHNVKMYFGRELYSALIAIASDKLCNTNFSVTIYTNKNLHITLCGSDISFVFDHDIWVDRIWNNQIVRGCDYDDNFTFTNIDYNLFIEDVPYFNKEEDEHMAKLIDYIHPNIYADYMMCMEPNDIMGLLHTGIANASLIETNKQLSEQLQSSRDAHKQEMENALSKINEMTNEIELLEIKNAVIEKTNYSNHTKYSHLSEKYNSLWEDHCELDNEFYLLAEKYSHLCDEFDTFAASVARKKEMHDMQLTDKESQMHRLLDRYETKMRDAEFRLETYKQIQHRNQNKQVQLFDTIDETVLCEESDFNKFSENLHVYFKCAIYFITLFIMYSVFISV